MNRVFSLLMSGLRQEIVNFIILFMRFSTRDFLFIHGFRIYIGSSHFMISIYKTILLKDVINLCEGAKGEGRHT